jgi:CDP-L-myo-inositol myo-inositolphosphotransferase
MVAPRRAVAFASAVEADRWVAGVPAAARMVRRLAELGAVEIWLCIGDGWTLAPATVREIDRLRGLARVQVTRSGGAPADIPCPVAPAMNAMDVLRGTAKPTDGIVSRYFNRPVSQRISLLALGLRGARPIHATIVSAMLAPLMFWGMLAGGKTGLILGAVLFHAASVIDGVDGEMARATWRTSDFGRTLDSAIDMLTNLAFILALTIHLGRHGAPYVMWTGLWGVTAFALGALLIAWRASAPGRPLSFDLLKPGPPTDRSGVAEIFLRIGSFVTSRDFFAAGFMVLIIAGLAWPALFSYTIVVTLWLLYVIATLLPKLPAGTSEAA